MYVRNHAGETRGFTVAEILKMKAGKKTAHSLKPTKDWTVGEQHYRTFAAYHDLADPTTLVVYVRRLKKIA